MAWNDSWYSKWGRTMTLRERAKMVFKVLSLIARLAPLAVIVEFISAILNSVIPIATAFFAGLTTTELFKAIGGDHDAVRQTIIYIIITSILALMNIIWASIYQYLSSILRIRVEAAITDLLYERFLHLDFWHYDSTETRDLYDKAFKFANFSPWAFSRLSNLISEFIAVIMSLVAIFFVVWWLALIILVAIIPSFILQLRLSRAKNRHWDNTVSIRRRRDYITWNLLQPEEITELRLYGTVKYILKLQADLRNKDERVRAEFERKYVWRRVGADLIQILVELGALVWIVLRIVAGAMAVGQFVYIQQIISRAFNSALAMVSGLALVDEDLGRLVSYQEFMEIPTTTSGERKLFDMPEEVSFSNVSFRYPTGENDVLKNINLTIKKGDHIAIVGENGAGKSTLIKLLTGLYKPTDGRVLLDGHPLQDFDVASWHQKVSVLTQDFVLYGHTSAKENITYGDIGSQFDEERFEKAMHRAEAKKFLEKLPNGVDSFVVPWMKDDDEKPGVELSGGQKQRLSLARNFYRDTDFIILDEPTSAIDALAEDRIFRNLFKEKAKTIVSISHRLNTVKRADKIYMFEDGKIVEQGSYDELLAKKGHFYRLFEAQL